MNKAALAAAGLVGACAACCAIPVTLPVLAGVVASGWVGVAAEWLCEAPGMVAGLAATSFALAAAATWWWGRRRSRKACAMEPTKLAVPSGCGCSAGAAGQGACR